MLLISFSMASIAACGGGGATGTGSTGGSTSGSTSASASASTGTGSATSLHGYIDIKQSPSGPPQPGLWGTDINAGFLDHVGGAPPACTSSMVAGCKIVICPGGGASEPVFVSAGDLSVDGLTDSSGKMSSVGPIHPDADLTYYSSIDFAQQKSFAGGETITVKASGGDLPAFTVTAPAPHLITQTTPDPGGSVTMDASSDFQVAWMSGGDGTVVITLQAALDDTADHATAQVTCELPASAGKGVVPTAVLQKLLTSPGTTISGLLLVGVESRASIEAGSFQVDMTVAGYAAQAQSFTLH